MRSTALLLCVTSASLAVGAEIDVRKIKLAATIKHDRPLWSCRFSPGGDYVLAGAHDAMLHRFEPASGAKLHLPGHRSWVRRLAFFPDGKRAVSGDYSGRLIWWDVAAAKPRAVHAVNAHRGYIRAVAVSPDGRWVATGGNDLVVRIWNGEGEKAAELPGHQRHVYNIAFHPTDGTLITGDLMGVLKQWETGTWKHLRDFSGTDILVGWDTKFQADCGGVRGLAFSPDGKTLGVAAFIEVKNAFAGVGTPAVVLFDWNTGKRTRVLRPAKPHSGACWGVVWHPGGCLIGVGGMNAGRLMFFKPDREKAFFEFNLPSVAYDLSLSPDGRQLAVACYDNALRVYRLGDTRPLAAPRPE